MTFKEKILSRKFLITGEVGPPKGADVTHLLEEAELFRDRVDATNVTDIQSSVMRVGSLAVSYLLKQRGHTPVFQMTCRDRNRLALQSDALSAAILGIENILALTGDHQALGDHPQAKGVFDLNSVLLIEVLKGLEAGHDMMGNKLDGPPPKFCVGAVVNPGADPIEPEIIKLEKKVKAGAEFIQTQAVYEPDKFRAFMGMIKHIKVPILVGIVLLKSAGMAKYMNKNVAGVFVPDSLIKEMETTKNKKETSVEIGARLINELKDLCQGVHIMPLGWDDLIVKVLDKAGLGRPAVPAGGPPA
ncbi:MAG: methylenetetrahydrofolate reductase [Candidatus Omnitrophica bacterium]|nr:methylenetetrahydrofolate reductase [Candidatus Omnitrophota bacterium]